MGDAFGPGSHASHSAGKPSSPSVSIPIAEAAICLRPDDTDVRLILHAELPRCPFCKGTPTTFTRFFERTGIYQAYVHCSWCMAQVFINSRDREDARNQAIDVWSRRAPDAALLAVLDRYADDLCEGYCEQSWDWANFDTGTAGSDCGGCLARRTAGQARAALHKGTAS